VSKDDWAHDLPLLIRRLGRTHKVDPKVIERALDDGSEADLGLSMRQRMARALAHFDRRRSLAS
jgi:hypothetical protein